MTSFQMDLIENGSTKNHPISTQNQSCEDKNTINLVFSALKHTIKTNTAICNSIHLPVIISQQLHVQDKRFCRISISRHYITSGIDRPMHS